MKNMEKMSYMEQHILNQIELFDKAGDKNPFYFLSNNLEDTLDVPQLKFMRKIFENIINQKQERGYA